MSRLVWDQDGNKFYEYGVDRGVIFPMVAGAYTSGAAWDGLREVTLSPSGAEATALWANNHKYGNLYSEEELAFTIGSYTYPDEFAACLGLVELAKGVRIAQQKRSAFGFTYRNNIGSDADSTDYKLHLIYGAMASPSEDSNNTVNDSPEAKEMSWECSTTPVNVTGFKPTSHIEIDTRTVNAEKLKTLEDILYGTEEAEPRLPLPDEVAQILGDAA